MNAPAGSAAASGTKVRAARWKRTSGAAAATHASTAAASRTSSARTTAAASPLAASPAWRDRAVLRQINQDSDAPLVDFRGQPTTHARFAASEKVKLVPVVAFYGPGGHRLADPIVGARLPDFYQSYLEEAIVLSATQLRQR